MTARWYPAGTLPRWGPPEIGALVAIDHGAWRVIDVRDRPRDLWTDDDRARVRVCGTASAPVVVICRPAHITRDDPTSRRHDQHLTAHNGILWHVYPHDHYPVCVRCGEPTPCRERTAVTEAHRAAEHMARFETPGICPHCQEPVTAKQGATTFDENLHVPAGPPVTFHTRKKCAGGLCAYEEEWIAADPDHRVRRYTRPHCPGWLTVHGGTDDFECTQGVTCPGPRAYHIQGVGACRCTHHLRWITALSDDARNLALDSS